MTHKIADVKFIEDKARQLRRDVITMVYKQKSGHIGGSLSIAEVISVLYYYKMKIDSQNPLWEDRDRFILSKGHNAPILYAALADKGFFDKGILDTGFRQIGGILQGHPDIKKTPGVDMTTGSLGIGLSAACGMALGARLKKKDLRVYVVIGDGEMNEGQIWEAAMTAAHYKLDNLCAVIDLNGMQNDGWTEDVMSMEPVTKKWDSFGWNVIEIDGHDIEQIIDAFNKAEETKGKPTAIIARTVKGKGVSFMENSIAFHGGSPSDEQYKKAMEELADKE